MPLRLIRRTLVLMGPAFLSALSCGGTSSSNGPERKQDCGAGSERCDCYPDDTCDDALTCLSGLCVSSESGDGDTGGTSGDDDGDGDTNLPPDDNDGSTGGSPGAGDGDTGGTLGGGDGDGDTGGAMGDGDTGGASSGGMGGSPPGTGGALPGTAVETHIPSGTFSLDGFGFGTESVTGFHGYAFTLADSGGSVVYPGDFSAPREAELDEGKLCAHGTVAQVVNMMFGETFGAGLGWYLNQELTSETAPIDVSGFNGLTFTVHSASPVSMRFSANSQTNGYCAVVSEGENSFTFTDLNSACWDGSGDFFDPEAEMIESITWMVASNTEAAVPFDLCVGGLTFH